MANPTVASYGSWKSPITSDLIVAETIRLGGVCIDGGDTYWLEMRPRESGRYVLGQTWPGWRHGRRDARAVQCADACPRARRRLGRHKWWHSMVFELRRSTAVSGVRVATEQFY